MSFVKASMVFAAQGGFSPNTHAEFPQTFFIFLTGTPVGSIRSTFENDWTRIE
jgi:hypothetical protein